MQSIRSAAIDDVTLLRTLIRGLVASERELDLVSIQESDLERDGFGTSPKFRALNAECTGTPLKEFRGAAIRPFIDGRLTAGVNFLIASGYTGQTTENFCQDTHRTGA